MTLAYAPGASRALGPRIRRGRVAFVLFGMSLLAPLTSAPHGGPERAGAVEARQDRPANGLRVVVHVHRRTIHVVDEALDTVFAAPVATGMERKVTYFGRTYDFATPRGRRTVIGKSRNPIWTVPDWHYYEKAARSGLEPVQLRSDDDVALSDGTRLVMRDGRVGRINELGFFVVLPIGVEIIFDGRLFIPPVTSSHRRVPGALGAFKLDLGDGYLIHGTNRYSVDSIGHAVTHGCIRMRDDDLARLYEMIPVGTPVDIL